MLRILYSLRYVAYSFILAGMWYNNFSILPCNVVFYIRVAFVLMGKAVDFGQSVKLIV